MAGPHATLAEPSHLETMAAVSSDRSGRSSGTGKLRVGFVMHVMQTAGAEMLVAAMIESLSDSIDATIFCLDDIGDLGSRLQEQGVEVVCLGRRPGFDFSVARRLAAEVNRRNIDILHAHQYTPFFYSALARLRGVWRTRLIFTEHGRHYPDVVGWKRRVANRLVLSRLAHASTACCQFSADAVESNDGFPRGAVEVLPNGIDAGRFQPRGEHVASIRDRLGLEADLQYIAMVARFHSVKDHLTLVDAFAHVADQRPEARLLLVGDGPERAAIESRIAQRGLRDRVQLWGVRRDVADILTAVDAFALSSVSEAASLTLLEAMACECPVVVTRVGGNPEIVRDEVDGFLTPRGDARAMGEALLKLLSDREAAKVMGQAGRQRVLQHYQQRDAVAAYEKLYRSVLAG